MRKLDYLQLVEDLWGIELSEPNKEGWANGLCPIHQGTHINFGVNINTGLYLCFKCGGGRIEDLVIKLGGDSSDLAAYDLGELTQAEINSIKQSRQVKTIQDEVLAASRVAIAKWAMSHRGELTYEQIEGTLRQYDYLLRVDPLNAIRLAEKIKGAKKSNE